MKILITGDRLPVRRHIEALQSTYDFELCSVMSPSIDVVIDNASTSAIAVKSRIAALGDQPVHYILVSSHRVYTDQQRLRPWKPQELNPCTELFPSLDADVNGFRAMERELLLAQSGAGLRVTVVRPAIVDDPALQTSPTAWYVRRVMDGGLVVLPEGDLPTYRQVTAPELARALVVLAGQDKAFGAVLNVANQAILGPWGHAALVRDALGLPLQINYVPSMRWRAAGLHLPTGESGNSALIEPSPLLRELGWRADDPVEGVFAVARAYRERGNAKPDLAIAQEHRVWNEAQADGRFMPGRSADLAPAPKFQNWALRAWAGKPAGLCLESIPLPPHFARPLVRVRKLSLGATEEKFMRGEYPQYGSRTLGHNAVLEVLDPGDSGLRRGQWALPVSTLNCGDPACFFCKGSANGLLGIGCDGYGMGLCSTPMQHLVPVPDDLGAIALLADPLAALMASLGPALAKDRGPVWIAGRTIEAVLAAWLAEEAGRPVVRADRKDWPHAEFPVSSLAHLQQELRDGRQVVPTLAIDFTGSSDVSWPLSCAMAAGSTLFARSRPPGIGHGMHWHMLAPATPDRATLEQALARLQVWRDYRNLAARVGPAIPLQYFWDVLLPAPFSLAYIEDCA